MINSVVRIDGKWIPNSFLYPETITVFNSPSTLLRYKESCWYWSDFDDDDIEKCNWEAMTPEDQELCFGYGQDIFPIDNYEEFRILLNKEFDEKNESRLLGMINHRPLYPGDPLFFVVK